MTNAEALYQAILANPDDDTPRLIYADEIEAQGEPERAEFIRLQIGMEEWRGVPCVGVRFAVVESPFEPRVTCVSSYCEKCVALAKLGQGAPPEWRVGQLLAKYGSFWLRGPASEDTIGKLLAPEYIFRRGFPACLSMTWESWVRRWEKLRSAIPLEEVELTTWPRHELITPLDNQVQSINIALPSDEYMTLHSKRFDPIPTRIADIIRTLVSEALATEWKGIAFTLPKTIRRDNLVTAPPRVNDDAVDALGFALFGSSGQ